MLTANEKYIDTTNIKHLLAAGEKNIDKIQITLSRYYMDEDLSESLFTLRAVNSANKLIMQNLQKEITNSKIILTWTVDETFTAVPGVLALEIIGQMQDIIVIKYEMSPMIVRGSILEQYDGGIDAIDRALQEMHRILAENQELILNLNPITEPEIDEIIGECFGNGDDNPIIIGSAITDLEIEEIIKEEMGDMPPISDVGITYEDIDKIFEELF